MARQNKTEWTNENVNEFINTFVQTEQKKIDTYKLIELMSKWSGYEALMWGPTIIGFGKYHYITKSGHEGDAPIIGFSPRKPKFSLYAYIPTEENDKLLNDLGKFTIGKVCIYFSKLSDLNLEVLEKLCKETIRFTQENYKCD